MLASKPCLGPAAVPKSDEKASGINSIKTKRSVVNHKIATEMKIREGCKNLLRAIPKTKENNVRREAVKQKMEQTIEKIATLLEELKQINGNMCSIQHKKISGSNSFPVIALGLKETNSVDLHTCFSEFVVSHYHEKQHTFDEEIMGMDSARELMRNAPVSLEGRDLVLQYYAILSQAEHRFFQEDKCAELCFKWFDTMDGQPVTHQSIRLEKTSVLFNVAALSSQLASLEDFDTEPGLIAAAGHFQTAAGVFHMLCEESKVTASTDICKSSLGSLSLLMLAQAQECLWHRSLLLARQSEESQIQADGHEAVAVAEWYQACHDSLSTPLVGSMPTQWLRLIELKAMLFQGIADWHVGSVDMVSPNKAKSIVGLARVMRAFHCIKQCVTFADKHKVDSETKATVLEYHNVVDAVISRVNQNILTQLLPKVKALKNMVCKAEEKWAQGDVQIIKKWTSVEDYFKRMGPVYFFNSMCALVEQRTIVIPFCDDSETKTNTLKTRRSTSVSSEQHLYGLVLSGGSPARISEASPAALNAGVRCGEYLSQVAGLDVRSLNQDSILEILKELAGKKKDLELTIVVNYDMQNFEELITPEVPELEEPTVEEENEEAIMPLAWSALRFELSGKRAL
eukprot:m.2901 g.2901  ORF g.2901 m.2901 type:complete len:627 (-) comp2614_c0_seq1:115-1995(-)